MFYRRITGFGLVLAMTLLVPRPVYAMHIMEGFLPFKWCVIWYLLSLPFVVAGFLSIKKHVAKNPELKLLLGVSGAFAFVLSALKIPSVTGSSSHPTGVGLGSVLFGPFAMSVIGCIVLLFQALLLAHGGISTLGANVFSMAVMGPLVSYWIFRLISMLGLSKAIPIFFAAALGNMVTYITTSVQLALAYPAEVGGIAASLVKFLGIFAITQIPLAVSEGLLTVVVFNFLLTYSRKELLLLKIFPGDGRQKSDITS